MESMRTMSRSEYDKAADNGLACEDKQGRFFVLRLLAITTPGEGLTIFECDPCEERLSSVVFDTRGDRVVVVNKAGVRVDFTHYLVRTIRDQIEIQD